MESVCDHARVSVLPVRYATRVRDYDNSTKWGAIEEAAREAGEGWKIPPGSGEVFNVNAGDRDWVNRQCTAQPLDTYQQRIHL
jgi:hypothetical protein